MRYRLDNIAPGRKRPWSIEADDAEFAGRPEGVVSWTVASGGAEAPSGVVAGCSSEVPQAGQNLEPDGALAEQLGHWIIRRR